MSLHQDSPTLGSNRGYPGNQLVHSGEEPGHCFDLREKTAEIVEIREGERVGEVTEVLDTVDDKVLRKELLEGFETQVLMSG